MTNYNERLDELLRAYDNWCTKTGFIGEPVLSRVQAKQAITSLIKELVAEAKPKRAVIHYDELGIDRARKSAANSALDRFEQNLLKALSKEK